MENSKISGLLWVIPSAITLSVLLFINVGSSLCIQYSIVSALALIGWLKFSYKTTPSQNLVVAPYILCVVLMIVLNTFRYISNFSGLLQTHFQHLFSPGFIINHTHWFVWMVCLPVSLMLFGGYFLSKRNSIGFFFAWWGFIFSIFEAIIQFKTELGNILTYNHFYFLGTFTAMLLFGLAVFGILKLIKPVQEHTQYVSIKQLSDKQKNLWSILFVSFVVVYAITLYTQAGLLPVGVIAGSMMGGMIGWRKTTSNFPADPYKLVPLYLLLQTLFYIHVGEEVLTNFNQGISSISGHPWSDREFDYLITFIGPVFWVFGAYSLWKGQAFGNFILWFMIVGMILGEPTHLIVFPVVRMVNEGVGYEYFSGMYTALFPMIPAILALVTIVKDHKLRNISTQNV